MTDQVDRIVFFDGECALCNRFVQFVLKHETAPVLTFASLSSAFAQETLKALHPHPKSDTIVFKEGDIFYQRSSASLRIAQYLKRPYRWAQMLQWVPRFLRDGVYDWVARHRHRIGPAHCAMPTAEQKHRFLSPLPTSSAPNG